MKDKKPGKKSLGIANPSTKVSANRKWTVFVIISSFVLSVLFSAVTTTMLDKLGLTWAFVILLVIIAISIIFDMIGTSAQTADEIPFHSLSARRISGASDSVKIIRSAPQVANLCCDVIGDICGIISGGATALIVEQLVAAFSLEAILPSLILTGLVSSLTIGGKALTKAIAMQNANKIIFTIGKIIYFLSFVKRLGKRKKRNG